jgi:phosphatidylinositol 4-kinase
MRVLEQHPVDLTFFFVPQCVQALRSDGLGYVERFIFETSKISQLFCHQIIWNMKANTYKDDDAVSSFDTFQDGADDSHYRIQ